MVPGVAYIVMAYLVMACIAMAYVVMVYVFMTCIAMAYVAMAERGCSRAHFVRGWYIVSSTLYSVRTREDMPV